MKLTLAQEIALRQALQTALNVLEPAADANIDIPATPTEFEILAHARQLLTDISKGSHKP